MLERGSLDIAIGGLLPHMPTSLRQTRLHTYDYVCIASRGNPDVRGPAFTRAQYCSLPHVVITRSGSFEDYLERTLRRQNIVRLTVLSLSNNLMAAELVAESDLLATVPRPLGLFLKKRLGVSLMELLFSIPQVTSRLYWHERLHRDPANRWFRDLARTHFLAPEPS